MRNTLLAAFAAALWLGYARSETLPGVSPGRNTELACAEAKSADYRRNIFPDRYELCAPAGEKDETRIIPGTWSFDADTGKYCARRENWLELERTLKVDYNLPPAPSESRFSGNPEECDIAWGHWKHREEVRISDLERYAREGRKGRLFPKGGTAVFNFGRNAFTEEEVIGAEYSSKPVGVQKGERIGVKTSGWIYVLEVVGFRPLVSTLGESCTVIPDWSIEMKDVLSIPLER